jgi:hypothetical protein
MTADTPAVNSICFGCAAMYGAEPAGHQIASTCLYGPCDNCGTVSDLCGVEDWHWPEGIPEKWMRTHAV